MKEIVFVTNNNGKIREISELLAAAGADVSSHYSILSLSDIGCTDEIPETGSSFAENAMQKAEYVSVRYNKNAFADDSGLEVRALGMEPGIYSARYSGLGTEGNIDKLLMNLQRQSNRAAQFHTVVTLLMDGERFDFEGICTGQIATERHGVGGFGYDPIFIPDEIVAQDPATGAPIIVPNTERRTFAEMGYEAKNLVSHRGKAIRKMVEFLKDMAKKD